MYKISEGSWEAWASPLSWGFWYMGNRKEEILKQGYESPVRFLNLKYNSLCLKMWYYCTIHKIITELIQQGSRTVSSHNGMQVNMMNFIFYPNSASQQLGEKLPSKSKCEVLCGFVYLTPFLLSHFYPIPQKSMATKIKKLTLKNVCLTFGLYV